MKQRPKYENVARIIENNSKKQKTQHKFANCFQKFEKCIQKAMKRRPKYDNVARIIESNSKKLVKPLKTKQKSINCNKNANKSTNHFQKLENASEKY